MQYWWYETATQYIRNHYLFFLSNGMLFISPLATFSNFLHLQLEEIIQFIISFFLREYLRGRYLPFRYSKRRETKILHKKHHEKNFKGRNSVYLPYTTYYYDYYIRSYFSRIMINKMIAFL